jgi:Flp pilus assembly protein TadG
VNKALKQPRRWQKRGQAMVEFAMVAPLFFALIFGLFEFSLIGVSISSFNFAADEGARIGSYLGRTDPMVDTDIVNAIAAHTSGVVVAQTLKIEIFKADATGQPVTVGGNIIENIYDINDNFISRPCDPGCDWPFNSRIDQLLSADFLGVRITYQYTYLTGFISGGNASLVLTATSVQRIEPQDYQGRRSPVPDPAQYARRGYRSEMTVWTISQVADRRRVAFFVGRMGSA